MATDNPLYYSDIFEDSVDVEKIEERITSTIIVNNMGTNNDIHKQIANAMNMVRNIPLGEERRILGDFISRVK